MITKYCEGFIFTPDYRKILLIEKNRPAKLAGLLNGIGGHIEEGETSLEAIVRETLEETGLVIPEENWQYFCKLSNPVNETDIDFWYTTYPDLNDAQELTDEHLVITDVEYLEGVVPNLKWLLPLCLDFGVAKGITFTSYGEY
jgi:8-oxo-dGTP diphosphatase